MRYVCIFGDCAHYSAPAFNSTGVLRVQYLALDRHAHAAYGSNASKRPLGRYGFAGVKKRPGAFYCVPEAFSEGRFRGFRPPGAIQKNKKKAHTSHTHTAAALPNV